MAAGAKAKAKAMAASVEQDAEPLLDEQVAQRHSVGIMSEAASVVRALLDEQDAEPLLDQQVAELFLVVEPPQKKQKFRYCSWVIPQPSEQAEKSKEQLEKIQVAVEQQNYAASIVSLARSADLLHSTVLQRRRYLITSDLLEETRQMSI